MNTSRADSATIPVGIVGLGLMGCSITTCLLMAGHPVVAVAAIPGDLDFAASRIQDHLEKSFEEGLTTSHPGTLQGNLVITPDYQLLSNCQLVIECTLENLEIKRAVFAKIES